MTDHLIVQSRAGAEETARRFLTSFGYTVYLPMALVERRHARKVEQVVKPFLSRVLFVEDDDKSHIVEIRNTPGVADFMRQGKDAIVVRGDVVEGLKSRGVAWKDQQVIRLCGELIEMDCDLKDGDAVNIKGGPFFGFSAVFKCCDGEERAQVFASIFGRVVKTTIALKDLERSNAA